VDTELPTTQFVSANFPALATQNRIAMAARARARLVGRIANNLVEITATEAKLKLRRSSAYHAFLEAKMEVLEARLSFADKMAALQPALLQICPPERRQVEDMDINENIYDQMYSLLKQLYQKLKKKPGNEALKLEMELALQCSIEPSSRAVKRLKDAEKLCEELKEYRQEAANIALKEEIQSAVEAYKQLG
jgi:hypothetical protein